MEKIVFSTAIIGYLAASLGFFVYLAYRRPVVSTLANGAVGLALIAHTAFIGLRSMETGHGPYTSTFEVALFLAWLIALVFLVTEWKYRIKDLGSFVIPLVFLILFFSGFLSQETALVEKSESQLWLTLHRTLSVLGYAAFSIAFAAGIMYLIQEHQVKNKKLGMMYFRMPSLEVLDNLNFKVVTLGFPVFTVGFLTGVIWNAQINSSIFSWDIFKTWPLVAVWVVYGLVFFGRFFGGLRGKRAAQGAIVGFVAVILTYFLHV